MPASRASRSAALAASGAASGFAMNGPFSGEARSSTGSEIAVATSASIHGARATSTGMSGSAAAIWLARSEEHTSELQSLMRISYAVFCLQKNTTTNHESSHLLYNQH